MRVCEKCGASDWGTRNRCNPCRAEAARADWAANVSEVQLKDMDRRRRWRLKNPEKVRVQTRRQLYGIDNATYLALLEAQSDRCAICEEPNPNCVDHCHRSRRVRGVLCRKCNAGLGQFRDDPERLASAIRYLARADERAREGTPAPLVPLRRRHRARP